MNTEKQREYLRDYYKKNKAKFIERYHADKPRHYERSRTRYLKIRQYILDVKSATPCSDCNVAYPACVMDFDHLRDKSFNVSNLRYWSSLDRVKDEIAKCDVVCANCHRLRTQRRKEESL